MQNKKNILFLSSWYPSKLETTNGNFVERHAQAVNTMHHVETLHCIGDPQQTEKYIVEDKLIHHVRTLLVYYRKTRNPLLNFYRRMRAYHMGFSKMTFPDLIHANILQNSMLFAWMMKKKYKIPYVVSEHWSGLLKINRKKTGFLKIKTAAFIARHADYILPVSQQLANDLQQANIGRKFRVVENVVDTSLFKPLQTNSTGAFCFLHISNLIPLKNPDKILQAAFKLHQKHPGFRLLIGGDGDPSPLKKMVAQNQAEDYVEIFGEQTLEQVAEKMRLSNCFLLFSDYENLPCVLLEAMSSGIPVISTKVGGVPEIVKEGCGMLIENSEKALYDAMLQMLEHSSEFRNPLEMHQYVEDHFSPLKIAGKFDLVYQEVLSACKT